MITTPSLLVPSILFPLFFFTAFAGGLSQVSNVPGFDFDGDYTSFQFVFVLLQSAAFGGVFTGFGVARDFEGGFARRLLLASPNRSGIVLGYGLAAVLRWSITATLLTVIALVVGMDVGGTAVDIVGLYTLALLLNMCGFAWSAGIAMRLRTMQAGPLMQMPVFLTLFFAPVYVPLDSVVGRDACRRARESGHVRAGGRPRLHLGRAGPCRARLCPRTRARRGVRDLGLSRTAGGRGGGRLAAPLRGAPR